MGGGGDGKAEADGESCGGMIYQGENVNVGIEDDAVVVGGNEVGWRYACALSL